MAGQVKADEPMGEVPDNANTNCPGTASDEAGKASACEGCPNKQICATMPKGPDPDLAAISERMSTIRHKVLVLSGKGGVGKSTFSAQLALALAARGKQVGLLDIDICGPSIPRMLALEGEEIHQSAMGWSPVYVDERLGVMSIGFLLPHPDEAVVWRGPRKNGLIKQFLKDVNWGELDYLVVDSPPGTSDEHISLAQYLKASDVDGAVVLTTPQEVSLIDVRKEINFCKKVGIPVLGVVENMSELQMPLEGLRFKSLRGRATTSGETTSLASSVDAAAAAAAAAVCASNGSREGGEEQDRSIETQLDLTKRVFRDLRQACPYLFDGSVVACAELLPRSASGGGEGMARDMGVPFLGRIPLDPTLSRAAEQGRSCLVPATQVDGELQEGESSVSLTPSAIALARIISEIVATVEGTSVQGQSTLQ